MYEHERHPEGGATFGETIVLFEAASHDELYRKAEAYWSRSVVLNPQFKRVGTFTVFAIQGEPVSGTEIWCELSEGNVSAEEFFRSRYEQFAIPPDESDA